MRRIVYAFTFVMLVAVFGAAVSAQDVTLEPTIPLPVTVEVTVQPPVDVTTEPSVEPTIEVTTAATSEMTAQPTAETTNEVPVTPEMTAAPTADSAFLRVAHFAPDAEGVDIYFNGSIAYKNLIYPSVSAWV